MTQEKLMISNAHVKSQGSSLKAERRLWTARRLYTTSLTHGKTGSGERTVNLTSSHHPAHGSLHISIKSSQRNMCRHKHTPTALQCCGRMVTTTPQVNLVPFLPLQHPLKSGEKGKKNPRPKVQSISILPHFGCPLPPLLFFHNIPWV